MGAKDRRDDEMLMPHLQCTTGRWLSNVLLTQLVLTVRPLSNLYLYENVLRTMARWKLAENDSKVKHKMMLAQSKLAASPMPSSSAHREQD